MTRTLPLGLAALLSALLLQGCAEDAKSTATPGPAQSTSLADCADVLPDHAFTSLGWQPSGEPALDSGTCTRSATQGDVAVQRWPVAAVGGDDLPKAAEKAFADRCKDLYGQAATRVDWLGSDMPGCVALGGRRGQSTILALTTHDTLVEARVSADEPTQPDRVRAGLVELAQAAASAF